MFVVRACQVVLCGVAAVAFATGCSAKVASPDGGDRIDARMSANRPDSAPFIRPDAGPLPDAMPTCLDSKEPNNVSTNATSLSATPVSDDDDSGGSIEGTVLNGDQDWFQYLGSDDLGNTVDPTVGLVSGSVEVCMFLDCVEQPQSFSCSGGSASVTDGALSGCCSTTGFTVDDLDCDPISDDANIYIRVKASAAGVCESYSLTYHY